MDVDSMSKFFIRATICVLPAEETELPVWQTHRGEWNEAEDRGSLAKKKAFSRNTRYAVKVALEGAPKDAKVDLCVELSQFDSREMHYKTGLQPIACQYHVWQVPEGKQVDELEPSFFQSETVKAKSQWNIVYRGMQRRYHLDTGNYVLIPSTWNGQKGNYYLRWRCEPHLDFEKHDGLPGGRKTIKSGLAAKESEEQESGPSNGSPKDKPEEEAQEEQDAPEGNGNGELQEEEQRLTIFQPESMPHLASTPITKRSAWMTPSSVPLCTRLEAGARKSWPSIGTAEPTGTRRRTCRDKESLPRWRKQKSDIISKNEYPQETPDNDEVVVTLSEKVQETPKTLALRKSGSDYRYYAIPFTRSVKQESRQQDFSKTAAEPVLTTSKERLHEDNSLHSLAFATGSPGYYRPHSVKLQAEGSLQKQSGKSFQNGMPTQQTGASNKLQTSYDMLAFQTKRTTLKTQGKVIESEASEPRGVSKTMNERILHLV